MIKIPFSKFGLNRVKKQADENTAVNAEQETAIGSLDTRVTALENMNPEIPAHTEADAGKFLGVDEDGDLVFDYAPDDELPDYSVSDAGKFLGVDAQGELAFENAPDDELPDYSISDAGKFLGVDAQGELEWAEAGGSDFDPDIIADEFDTTPSTGPTYEPGDRTKVSSSNFYVCITETNGQFNNAAWHKIDNVVLNQAYVTGDMVKSSSKIYQALSDNTPTQTSDVTTNPTVWQDITSTFTTYDPGTPHTTYSQGTYVIYNDALYRATITTYSGWFNTSAWTLVSVTSELRRIITLIPDVPTEIEVTCTYKGSSAYPSSWADVNVNDVFSWNPTVALTHSNLWRFAVTFSLGGDSYTSTLISYELVNKIMAIIANDSSHSYLIKCGIDTTNKEITILSKVTLA